MYNYSIFQYIIKYLDWLYFRRGPGGAGSGRNETAAHKALQATTLVGRDSTCLLVINYILQDTLDIKQRHYIKNTHRVHKMTVILPPFLNYPGG